MVSLLAGYVYIQTYTLPPAQKQNLLKHTRANFGKLKQTTIGNSTATIGNSSSAILWLQLRMTIHTLLDLFHAHATPCSTDSPQEQKDGCHINSHSELKVRLPLMISPGLLAILDKVYPCWQLVWFPCWQLASLILSCKWGLCVCVCVCVCVCTRAKTIDSIGRGVQLILTIPWQLFLW